MRPHITRPEWQTWREIPRVVLHRPHLKRTFPVALLVGSVLFAINHLDVVIGGRAPRTVLAKIIATYFVPFVVANYGILVTTRRGVAPRGAAPSRGDLDSAPERDATDDGLRGG